MCVKFVIVSPMRVKSVTCNEVVSNLRQGPARYYERVENTSSTGFQLTLVRSGGFQFSSLVILSVFSQLTFFRPLSYDLLRDHGRLSKHIISFSK
jgi:hypothetical protein